MQSWLAPLITAAMLLLCGALLVFMYAVLTGWSRLADRYRFGRGLPATRWRHRHVYLKLNRLNKYTGWGSYATTIAIDDTRLYFGKPCLLCHPRLLVPWTDVSIRRKSTRLLGFLCGDFAELRVKAVPDISIFIGLKLARQIVSHEAGRGAAPLIEPS